jgi:hypothetical protein
VPPPRLGTPALVRNRRAHDARCHDTGGARRSLDPPPGVCLDSVTLDVMTPEEHDAALTLHQASVMTVSRSMS